MVISLVSSTLPLGPLALALLFFSTSVVVRLYDNRSNDDSTTTIGVFVFVYVRPRNCVLKSF